MARKSCSWNQVTTIHSFKDSKVVRVFGVARVSTDKQAKKIGESLDHQKEVLKNWVKSKSSLHAPQEWKLVQVFVENEDSDGKRRGRTATKRENRKGLEKALQLARLKLVDVVVITKLDRIARNVRDYIEISAEFNECEVALVCLDLDIDTSTPDGQMIMRNHANLAQWQAERIAQYSIETIQRHIKQGRPIGPPPVGYRKAKDDIGKTTFEPDPTFKQHVQFMDKTYLRLKSVDKTIEALHKKGYKSPKGKTYSKPQVSRILQNVRYTGRQDYDDKIFDGNWKPIRSLDVHEIIQNIFGLNRKSRHSANCTSQKYVYLAQSLLKCSECGSSMIARPGTGRGGKYYPYYMCLKAHQTNGIDCDRIYLAAEAVDNALIEILRNLRLNSRVVSKIVMGANQTTASTINVLKTDLERIQSSLKNIRAKTSNLVDILAEQGMSKLGAIKGKLEALNQEEEELALEEKRLHGEIQAEKVQAGTAHEYIKTLQLFNDFYLMNQDNKERIQTLMPRLINSVICYIIDRKKGIGRLKIGLFGRPFERGPNAEVWNKTLQKIADECYNKKILKTLKGKLASKPQTKKKNKSKTISCRKTEISSTVCVDKRFYSGGSYGVTATTPDLCKSLQCSSLQ
ncbi:recombinase family protein [Candidatus Pacearchaeota archaeon]|nr:recombinase family protein [Candidatus Pacearchaeota archaeon]